MYSPKELASELNASLGNVTYHVTILRALGMIELVSTRRRGAVEHFYKARWRAWVELEPVDSPFFV